MNFTPEELHELAANAARLSAIVSLLGDATARAELDPIQTDHDVREALENFGKLWERAPGKRTR